MNIYFAPGENDRDPVEEPDLIFGIYSNIVFLFSRRLFCIVLIAHIVFFNRSAEHLLFQSDLTNTASLRNHRKYIVFFSDHNFQ